ncbi:hypothetical protein LCL85_13025 [Vibrio alginolyticus]|nr:hypothetical protein [Vibrio alginolyticus]
MENYQSHYAIASEESVRKLQRILDKLISEMVDKQHYSGQSAVILTRESQLRLMNYKELYLHRDSIGEEELMTLYEKMSVVEKEIADEGISALTFIIEALDKMC